MFEQKKITAVEERRKQQENRKFSKALKSHKAKEKTEDKKRTLDAVKQWKKDKAHRYVHGEGLDGGRGGGGKGKEYKFEKSFQKADVRRKLC